MSSPLAEVCAVLKLALPAVLTNCFASLLQLVDASFVGHIGPLELSAASLGNAYFSMGWFFIPTPPYPIPTPPPPPLGSSSWASRRRWTRWHRRRMGREIVVPS